VWDGSAFSSLPGPVTGNGVNGVVWSLAIQSTQNRLILGGDFTAMADGSSAKRLVAWTGTAWANVTLNAPVGGFLYAVAEFNGRLFYGGTFRTLEDGSAAGGIAVA
jgi:hypothetical protein